MAGTPHQCPRGNKKTKWMVGVATCFIDALLQVTTIAVVLDDTQVLSRRIQKRLMEPDHLNGKCYYRTCVRNARWERSIVTE